MAEVVGLHTESMIPELEQMKRIGLFTPEEIQEIVKKRKEFEYKISRTMKEKEKFLEYIKFEVKLLRQIKLRRDKMKMIDKKSEIEFAVAKKIVKIYQLLLSYFKSDVKLWISYINFCTQTRFTSVVSQAFQQMLQVHSDKKHLWIFAAKWELTESNNLEGALNYLKTGLHHHPDSQELYIEAFRLELKSATIFPPEEIQERQEKALRRASVHFKVAINAIGNDVEFIINLLNIATEFRYTEELQKEIIEYLTKNCWKEELMWHTMAQRELNGHFYDKKDVHKSRVRLCLAVYQSAIKILPTREMWGKYLDCIIEISQNEKRKNSLDNGYIKNTFLEGHKGHFLEEHHYVFFIEFLRGADDREERERILDEATKKIKDSVEIWLLKFNHYVTLDNESDVKKVSEEAIEALGPNALRIYEALLTYYQLKNNFATQKSIFEQGINSPYTEISLPLRPQYIQWLCLFRNLKYARSEYEKMATNPPFSLDLHKKMIELELQKFSPSIPIIRNIYKRLAQQFGKEKVEVWIDYIKFETEHGDPSNVSAIYNQAKNTLNENLVAVFTTDFAILNTQ